MSYKGSTETFYREIINKVTEKMKDEYNNEGIGEDTLILMKKKWEEKMMQEGIFDPRPNQLNYFKNNPGMKYNINPIDNRVVPPFNTFKSTPSNTTADNIKRYMESKQVQQYPVSSQKFYTTPQMLVNGTMEAQNISIKPVVQEVQPVEKEIKKEANEEEDKKEEDNSADSEYEIFNQQKKNKEKDKEQEQKEEDDEVLSSLSSESIEQEEAKDFLLAQYEKVHRVRNKWKIGFKDAVLHFNGKEYVFDKVVGELDRDW